MSNKVLMDIMEPEKKRAKLGEREENKDRLSDLPDCLILCILTLVSYKDVVATCILSRRWEHLWRCLPTLVLHESYFRTKKIFDKFVPRLLSRRDHSFALHTLDFKRLGIVEPHILKRVISYAISHEVQQLAIEANVNFDRLPPSIYSSIFLCQTLTYLKLSILNKDEKIVFPKSLNLPALTSLILWNIDFFTDESHIVSFRTLNRLKILVICDSTGGPVNIASKTLSSLTICQRKSAICEFRLFTPNLCSIALDGTLPRIYSMRHSPANLVKFDEDISPRIYSIGLSSVKRVKVDEDILNGCLKPPLIR